MDALQGTYAAQWLSAEFAKPASLTYPRVTALGLPIEQVSYSAVRAQYWDHILTSDDQLRQRMAYALSQIFVYSGESNITRIGRLAHYQDVLINSSLSNYRDVLEEVTYTPAMAQWLTYMRNRKGDPATGRMPDENYAREIMQLFTIGLVELNMDGTVKTDGSGNPIETYNNSDIIGLARVFTGLGYEGPDFNGGPRDSERKRLKMFPEQHSQLEKSFLGLTIPAGTPGDESIELALDQLFEHPNVAPFVSRQLIQRFTSSSPSPAYVERVATVFENGQFTDPETNTVFGTGERGDLQATLAAILLDPSTFSVYPDGTDTIIDGKVREPILLFTNWARTFNVGPVNTLNESELWDTTDPGRSLGQQAFHAPSVFNFYRPGYVPPGTESGTANLTVPEFQIMNESSKTAFLNFITKFTYDDGFQPDRSVATFVPDLSEEIALTNDLPALVEHLDTILAAGRMTDAEKQDIQAILEEMSIDTSSSDAELRDRTDIARVGVILVVASSSFAVVW